ncbi:MAG TPA: FkbM family methyltransferase [Pyrinomonadaceae bacterium]|nr:FkbM family methyltransferase [Pyrinomonadaceae bacterium]
MKDSLSERELEELLAESPEEADRRAELRFVAGESAALVLYGAGTLGRDVLSKLRRVGVEPAAFADDTLSKQGSELDGLPVLAPREAVERFGPQTLFVVTILNPALRFLEARARLAEATGARVASFLDVAWKYPETFLPHYQFVLPREVLGEAEEVRRAFYLFDEEESRRQFVAHLRFRLRLEHEALPANSRAAYFPSDVPLGLGPDASFVDCGAFDGDTLRRFVAHQRGRFHRAYAFEPDPANCRRLRDYVASLGAETAERVLVFNAGVGAERGRLRFRSTGDMSAAFMPGGGDAAAREADDEIEVLALDEVVKADERQLYLKFDVEGAEWEALAGARRLIGREQPLLGVSIYHRPADLWRLPLLMREMCPESRLYLRTEGEDGMDLICYAVPPGGAS